MSTLIAALFVVQPALAQNKAATAKLATEFQQQSVALATTLAALSKRVATASPNDKEMLKLVNNQLGLVDATADGVLALGFVAAEVPLAPQVLSALQSFDLDRPLRDARDAFERA